MEATSKTQAIVLRREPWNGSDSRIFVYTPALGKLNLVARGTRKISSKLAPHLEPFNWCEIMLVKGRQYDYIGSCVSGASYRGIKSDYGTAIVAAGIAKIVHTATKEHSPDERVFFMLKKFLDVLDSSAAKLPGDTLQLLASAFILKLVSVLGYQPRFESLWVGNQKISPKLAHFMRMLLGMAFEEILRLPVEPELAQNFSRTLDRYTHYLFD